MNVTLKPSVNSSSLTTIRTDTHADRAHTRASIALPGSTYKHSVQQDSQMPTKSARKSPATRNKMAQSQQARRAVSNYLDALHAPKRRGRRVSTETLKQRLRDAESKASKSVGMAKLDALKEVDALESRLKATSSTTAADMKALEQAFIKHAKAYSARKDVPYHVWRRAGVPASVLQRAGIGRTPA